MAAFSSLYHQFHIKMLAEGALFHLSESSPSQSVIGPWPLAVSMDTRRLCALGGCHLLTMSQKAGSQPSHPGASPSHFISISLHFLSSGKH